MSKKSAKIAATYFITILLSLVLIGGVGYFFLNAYLNQTPKESKLQATTGISSATEDDEEFVPDEGDSRTVLFVYEADMKSSSVCFVLARLIPLENKLVIVPLQSDLCMNLDGMSDTLYEFYRTGGVSQAKRAVEAATGINVDNYMKLDRTAFTLFSNFMGNVSYDVPYNLIYEDEATGESTVLKSGEQMLDAVTLRKVLTFPVYKSGEEYRAKVVGTLAVELVNSGSAGILRDGLDNVFTELINSDMETDISRYDYEDSAPAIKYILANTTSPSQLVIPSGAYNENGCYVLDENFVEALPRWFGLE